MSVRPTGLPGIFFYACPEHGVSFTGSEKAAERFARGHLRYEHGVEPEPFDCADCGALTYPDCCEVDHDGLCCSCAEQAAANEEADRAMDLERESAVFA